MDWQPGNHQTMKWKTYGFVSHRGLPGAVIYDNPYSAERLADKNVFTQFAYENRVSRRVKLKAAANGTTRGRAIRMYLPPATRRTSTGNRRSISLQHYGVRLCGDCICRWHRIMPTTTCP